MPTEQNYSNHVRWNRLFHFVLVPLLVINLLWQVVQLIMAPSWAIFFGVLLGFTLILLAVSARLMALKAQDRVIRLEERLRHQQTLEGELLARSGDLTPGQVIALRFAPDDELAELVDRTLNGEFARNRDIKAAVKNWRADHHRV